MIGLLLGSQVSYASSEQRCGIATRAACHAVIAGIGGGIAMTGLIMIGQDFAGYATGEMRYTNYKFNNTSMGIKFFGVGSSIAAHSWQRSNELEQETRVIARQIHQDQLQNTVRLNDENV